MKRSAWPWAATALALLFASAAVQAAAPGKNHKDKDEKDYRVVTIQPYRLLVRTTGGTDCNLATATQCTITVKPITVSGRNYCLVEAPNIKVPTDTGGAGHLRAIVWKLSATTLGGKPVAFSDGTGIIVPIDGDNQIDKSKQGYGDGSGGGANPPTDQYYVKTKRNKVDAKASYLPVVLWGSASDAELCAASDPKIVNVP